MTVANSLLVTTVVTFVLLPARIKSGDFAGARRMLGWRPQLMHNANLLFATTELLLNRIPIVMSHSVVCMLFGVQYVFISWWWLQRTGVVYYPFLDPTLPPRRSIAFHTALVGVLASFFALVAAVDRFAAILPFAVRAPLLYAAACSLMWTRWIRGRPGELARGAGGEEGSE